MAVARLILDRSGSMDTQRETVTPAVNGFLGNLLKDPTGKEALFWGTTFDSMGFDEFRKGLVAVIKPLAPEEFVPRALTPLLDAVGAAIGELDSLNDPKTMLAILTDGLENASRRFNLEKIREMIEERRRRGWIIVYLGANINAWEEAAKLGIPNEHAINFTQRGGATTASAKGGVSPIAVALIAAAGLATAWWAMSSSPAQGSTIPGFDEATRNAAMGVDGVSMSWQDAVAADVAAFVEPFNSVFDLAGELPGQALALPDDFDPSLGSMNADGTQSGVTDGSVLGGDHVGAINAGGDTGVGDDDHSGHDGGGSRDAPGLESGDPEIPEVQGNGASGALAAAGVTDTIIPEVSEVPGIFDTAASGIAGAASAVGDGIAGAAGALGEVAGTIGEGIADVAGGVAEVISDILGS